MCVNHTFSGRRLVSTSSSAPKSVRAGAFQARPVVAIKISVRTRRDRRGEQPSRQLVPPGPPSRLGRTSDEVSSGYQAIQWWWPVALRSHGPTLGRWRSIGPWRLPSA